MKVCLNPGFLGMRRDEEERKEDKEMRYMELHESLPLFVGGCEQGQK